MGLLGCSLATGLSCSSRYCNTDGCSIDHSRYRQDTCLPSDHSWLSTLYLYKGCARYAIAILKQEWSCQGCHSTRTRSPHECRSHLTRVSISHHSYHSFRTYCSSTTPSYLGSHAMECFISGFVCRPCRLWTFLLLLQITLSCGMGGGSWWNDRRTEEANRRNLWNCRSWMIVGKRNGHERVTWKIWSSHDSSMCIRSLISSPTIYCGLQERSYTAMSTRIS